LFVKSENKPYLDYSKPLKEQYEIITPKSRRGTKIF
jgi:hypothetical protein